MKKLSRLKSDPRSTGLLPLRLQRPKIKSLLRSLQRIVGNRVIDRSLRSMLAPQSGRGLSVSRPGQAEELAAEHLASEMMNQTRAQKNLAEENQTKAPPLSGPAAELESSLGPGRPLSENERAFFEGRLGKNLEDVRVHTDTQAADMAEAMDAQAFTLRDHIVFGEGEYRPHTQDGKSLLAHELGHVAQQGRDVQSGGSTSPDVLRAPKEEDKDGKEKLIEGISLFGKDIPKPFVTRLSGGIVATIYFGHNAFLMDPANFKAVEKLAEELRYLVEPSVMVNGHASTEGKETDNLALSERRRQAVIAILNSKRIGSLSFTGEAFGETKPDVPETAKDSAELERQRARNRRVEIVILHKAPKAPPKPDLDPKKIIELPRFKPEFKPETPEERLNRILREPPPSFERPKISLKGALEKKFDDFMDDVLSKIGVNPKYHDLIKDGARSLVEKGLEKGLDTALDGTNLNDEAKQGIKKAIEAGVKTEFEK